ncbi:hypothetical protein QJS10_CPB18g00229 [Acorus calamus]|uniref:Deubiquitinating enzyme MINDY-3/4 conserved domain-containing protein n=1 Tax=Acorus calamus TaxID=4465 RepID=A0AAV9CQL8_ACOCL|nr:hypothetical protein QJS10_CPB18g00229 [Acorus calamus]
MGLVQHEGGPCGVLATIQAYVLKYLLFYELSKSTPSILIQNLWSWRFVQRSSFASGDFSSISADERKMIHLLPWATFGSYQVEVYKDV